ncbi:MAG: hypothetical protein F6J89_14620 [Symploca sp. SIO1C4]|uniref:SPOR domain-containing protein n=1 Tax=Symploca sp. SIO1C4 TaxID=2607765 RepID=A0A6B3NAY6_9CYAN|nr:hypothetical protein [Symploca sp. SIO1C4]NET07473.1 hypothetical protein [Symploca sp. SIO2B6]NET51879.1 hypothetical protein [Merismopedia sp. SIO2A8]
MSYSERLKPWAVVRLLPNKLQWSIIGRYRSRSDAEGHLKWWRRNVPDAQFEIIFDVPTGSQ